MFCPGGLVLLTSALGALISPTLAAPAHVVASRQAAPLTSRPRNVDNTNLGSGITRRQASSSSFWLADIQSTGTVWGGGTTNTSPDSYQVFRNVQDSQFGAKGDGTTDDTEAIQKAIAYQDRCGFGCNSSTILPGLVYFPPGKYLISKPIKMYYMTQMVGDAINKPTLLASGDFTGIAMLDSDPYEDSGANWWVNQNNFFRQIRNFVIDLTASTDAAVGIHWQVAQATSLQNIDFKMKQGTKQQGIFMDNGSGGYMSDLTFEGGQYGAFLGSQQFTCRNMVFNNVDTAIFMNWNWGWTLSNITITGGTTGIDMSNSPANQTVGSVVLTDSSISSQYGIKSAYGGNSTSNGVNTPATGGTLVLDNVDLTGTQEGVYQNATQKTLLPGGQVVKAWVQGNSYINNKPTTTAGPITPPNKAAGLLADGGKIFGRSKPQYENLSVGDFLLAQKDGKCAGDGQTDDTKCIADFLSSASQQNKVAYFEHGAYLVKDTVVVPDQIKMTGEVWPLIMADGPSFSDASKPKAVFQVGSAGATGATGAVEISDLIFQTKGPAPGAVMIEWNLNSAPGASGMWDTHVRIGGSVGSGLQTEQCRGEPGLLPNAQDCMGVFLMFHATKSSGGVYLENDWFWVADHDLDTGNQTQISLFSARGALFESQNGPVWLWGTASEHSIIYNYQVKGVKAFFGGFMQSETPYFQPEPEAPGPLVGFNRQYDDPSFTICPANSTEDGVPCKDAWGLRIWDSKALIYATGLYSFFNNYEQQCVGKHNCQEYMMRIQNSDVDLYTITTKAALKMIADDRFPGKPVMGADNRNVFGDTVAYYSNH